MAACCDNRIMYGNVDTSTSTGGLSSQARVPFHPVQWAGHRFSSKYAAHDIPNPSTGLSPMKDHAPLLCSAKLSYHSRELRPNGLKDNCNYKAAGHKNCHFLLCSTRRGQDLAVTKRLVGRSTPSSARAPHPLPGPCRVAACFGHGTRIQTETRTCSLPWGRHKNSASAPVAPLITFNHAHP